MSVERLRVAVSVLLAAIALATAPGVAGATPARTVESQGRPSDLRIPASGIGPLRIQLRNLDEPAREQICETDADCETGKTCMPVDATARRCLLTLA